MERALAELGAVSLTFLPKHDCFIIPNGGQVPESHRRRVFVPPVRCNTTKLMLYYLLDPSSLLPVKALAIEPHHKVCA